jgi:hypothetical protein
LQGNGAGPQIWAAISTVILSTLRNSASGGTFQRPISSEVQQIVGFAFVDDTDLIVCSPHDLQTASDITSQMQTLLQFWEGGIIASGGQLEASKTFWYMIDFEWESGAWKYKQTHTDNKEIFMQSIKGNQVTIKKVDVREGRRTLGVRLAPDGNFQAEFMYLTKEADSWAEKIRTGMLPKKYTWQAYTSTIMAKLGYALPSTTFTEQQCHCIGKNLVAATLQKLGINKNFPRDLAFAPVELQGLGITNLFIKQGSEILLRVVKFMIDDTSLTGHLLHTSYQYLQLELGHCDNVFALRFSEWGGLATHGYLKTCWEFCNRFNIELHPKAHKINPRREFDQTIMSMFSKICSCQQLQIMNRCRIRLQLLWVSDLATGNGTSIRESIRKGVRDNDNKSLYRWPQQGDLPPSIWKEWDKYLQLALGYPHSKGPIILRTKLGRWLDSSTCDWFICKDSDQLYQKSTAKVFACTHKSKTRLGSKYTLINSHKKVPEDCEGTTVYARGNSITAEGSQPFVSKSTPVITNIQQFIQTQPQWEWHLLSKRQLHLISNSYTTRYMRCSFRWLLQTRKRYSIISH